MPQLVVVAPHGNEWRLSLDADEYVIGRDPNLSIPLNDVKVSRRHARLFRQDSKYWIEDLGSANGVVVNGVAIQGPAPLASGFNIDIGGFLLAYAGDAMNDAPTAELVLIGQTGPVAGHVVPLAGTTIEIGRGKQCAIVIDDTSLSRRHAVLHITSTGIEVEDCGSSNGTYVNDLPVTRQTCGIGDRLRFGQVEFVLQTAAPGKPPTTALTRALRIVFGHVDRGVGLTVAIGLLTGVLLFAGVITLYHRTSARTPAPRPIGKEERGYNVAVKTGLAAASAHMQSEAWAQAITAYQDVLEHDPINQEARAGLAIAELNRQQLTAIAQAQEALQQGQPTRALGRIASILPAAHYGAKAAALASLARAAIGAQAQSEAQLACRRDDFRRCHQQAILLLTYVPNSVPGMALVSEAEIAMAARHLPFTPWGSGNAGNAGNAGNTKAAVIHTWYRDLEVRGAVLRYASGDLDTALRRLHTFARRPGASAATAALQELRRNQMAGDTAQAAGDETAAMRAWVQALQRDAKLVPETQPSAIGAALRQRLGTGYLRLGEAAFNRGSYGNAYAQWQKGLEVDTANSELAAAMAKLEGRAAGLLAELSNLPRLDEAACAQLREVLAMTQGDSPTHRMAKDKLAVCKNG